MISGTGTLTQIGAGTLLLTGGNTYTGLTSVNAGTLQIGNGVPGAAIGGNVNVGAAGTLVVHPGDDLIYTGVISGNGTFVKLGGAVLTLPNTNTFSGTAIINAGTLRVSDDSGANGDFNAVSIVVNNGGRFEFVGPAGNPDLPATTVITINSGGAPNSLSLRYGGIILKGGAYNTSDNHNLTGGITSLLESGTISGLSGGAGGAFAGTGSIRKATAGIVTITGVNLNNSGGLAIDAGVLSTNAAIVGSGAFTFGTNGGGATNGTLQYRGATAAVSRALTLNDGGGTFDITELATIYTLSGAIGGTGSLTKIGPGILDLTAANSTYTGTTTISAGTSA